MKKSLLALAVLGAFAGAASAQSSVTVYGKLNVEAGKAIGKTDKALNDVAGSRLGFRGVEDMGGGLKATFGMEHRFNPSTGADASTAGKFWNGYSKVGIAGDFGHIELGRDYTVAFLMIQNQIDPFGGDTAAALRGIAMYPGKANNSTGNVRFNGQVEYHFSANGFNFGAQVAGANEQTGVDAFGGSYVGTKKAYSFAANYAAGPLFVGAGYENGADKNDKLFNLGARYNLGVATVVGSFTKGTTELNQTAKGYLIGATVPVGAGDFKVGYARSQVNSVTNAAKMGVGYHYNLSKRTKVFADFARDSKAATEKSGYDVGMQHNF